MRCILQRVKDCSVTVNGNVVGAIKRGLLLYLGITQKDSEKDVEYLVKKTLGLRIFEDQNGKMNLSVTDFPTYQVMVISQFTLYGTVTKGRRPSYDRAAHPEHAEMLYEYFLSRLKETGIGVESGVFQSHMDVEYCNSGPVTILMDSEKTF
jgi:D-aminoacyl-tRNA deacylase